MGKTVNTQLLDTNVLVRFLVRDNEPQYQQAKRWFEQAEHGEKKIVVLSLVAAEACFVLESFYKKSRTDISEAMIVFLSQRWLQVPERTELLTLWKDYTIGFHFVDSYLLAFTRAGETSVLSFDERLKRKQKT